VSQSLLRSEITNVLRTQGIDTSAHIGLLDAGAGTPAMLQQLSAEAEVVDFKGLDEAVRAARSGMNFVFVVGVKSVLTLIEHLGAEGGGSVPIIAVGGEGPSAANLRSAGAMAVVTDPTEEVLRPLVRRGLEYRALRALELAHRCEARRIRRREMDLLGHPPETMTDDLSTFQPPPLPVGPISTYNLEDASDAFERAYIDRVQHLCASAREAAQYLDVSAATLARRLRKEGVVPNGA
jgi:hypothetical protein